MTKMCRKAAEFWWKIKVPKNVKYYWHDGGTHFGTKPDWKVYTWQEEFQRRKENLEHNLWVKRECYSTKIIPCYVWVFFNPHFPYSGWWIYIKTSKEDFGINFRYGFNRVLIEKAMNMFPMGVFPTLENFDEWAEVFTKKFPHVGFKRRKKQGLKRCWCKIESGKLIDLSTSKNF